MSYWKSDGLYVYDDGKDVHLWVYRKTRLDRPPAQTDREPARDAEHINGIRMPEALFQDFIVRTAERLRREGTYDQVVERLTSKYGEP